MLKLIFLSFCVCYSFTLAAQNSKQADSLLKALDNAKTDSSRMKLYSRIGNYYMDNNAGKAIGYLQNARQLAQKLQLPLQVANYNYSIGYCYLMKGDFDKSLQNYQESVRGYEKLKDSFRLGNAYMSIGNVYFQNKDFDRTNQYYNLAQQLITAQKDSMQLINIFAERGMLYDQQKLYDSAIIYLQKALELSRKLGNREMFTSTLANIGLTYKHQKNTAKALECFDSVLLAYKTMDIPVDNFAVVYNNIGATHSQAGNFAKAKEAFDKSIAFSKQAGSPMVEMENYNNLSDMFGNMKNYALQTQYLKKYYNIKDSLFTADNNNQLTQIEADYQVEKKNAEIIKKDIEVNRQKNQRNIFIIVALAAAVVLAALAFLYNRIKNNNRVLQQKNERIHQQNIELEKLNQVKDRLFSIISHDLRNPLVTLRSYLSLADDVTLSADKKELFKKSTMQAVTQTCEMLDNLLVWANLQIKSTQANITPINIEDCVLDVLDTVRAQAMQKNITLHTNIDAAAALGDHTIITIALRNLLTNAIKFSNADSNIFISSIKKSEVVMLTVKDEGLGMTEEQLQQLATNQTESTPGTDGERGSGLGVFLVKELLQKTNAQLLIESTPGKGSSFKILMPSL